jgi:malonyl-CoA O-methyltransferase
MRGADLPGGGIVSERKARIAARFGAAAAGYDAASPLQREAATRLAQRIAALPRPAAPRVLEIGCGTGHLTRALAPVIGGTWTITDIAPEMVAACRADGFPAAHYFVMDGEHPACAPGSFDLVVSSLAAQWFADLPAALAGLATLLAPGGRIALATLGAATFAEWRAAHAAQGLRAATPDYPDRERLRQSFPAALTTQVTEETFVAPLEQPLDFVRGLRAIGADTPAPGSRPLTAGQLRRVLSALAAPAGMSYHLLYAVAMKPG